MHMKIKVCGMKYAPNIAALAQLPIDYMGFIFYPPSARYADSLDVVRLPAHIQKVGVFVNASLGDIADKVQRHGLQIVQLHGQESTVMCRTVRDSLPVQIIKAFSVDGKNSLAATEAYVDACDLFLFDTLTPLHGGSGKQFDWSTLQHYTGKKQFLLSGGIGLADVAAVRAFSHPACLGVDLNSRFEIGPACKDIAAIGSFIKQLGQL